ncbi:MAG: hypothetical protein WBB86_08235, partial [Candidatus Omnitrophota bacterium]
VTSFFTKTPPYWILTGSNIEGLFGKAPSAEPGRAIPPEEAAPEAERPRLILLKNGGVLKGVISKETKTYIVLELGGGSTTISKEEIKEIR